MKTMTCRQMGGPCDKAMQAESADEMMGKGAAHVNEMAGQGDTAHQGPKQMMEEMQQNPESDEAKAWGEKFHTEFEALPQD